ncbi:hypothetical protein AB0E82_39530 [Streptomyces anulatus]|uniref:hypothetical protein n=1 Tax=Streptomyces anulatus TaxID=1892 RepID=UPI0033D30971
MSVTFTAELAGEPVNMANANAARVLGALGYAEPCGVDDAESFLGRVLIALAVDPVDAGRPATAKGRLIDCGRPQGYVQERLGELRALAEFARERRLDVVWG